MATPAQQFHAFAAGYLREARGRATAACDGAADLLLAEMRALTSLIDHDLRVLRRLRHPYGRRRPPNTPHPDWLLHVQSGGLQAGLGLVPTVGTASRVSAAVLSRAPYTGFVVLGTRLMRPRDFVSAAVLNREAAVAALFQRAFEPEGAFRPAVRLTPHDAQLPGGVA